MTTIAYKSGLIAYDSRCCCGSQIVDDDFNKHRFVDGVHFFFAGNTGDQDMLIEHYFGQGSEIKGSHSADALIVHKDKLYTAHVSDREGFHRNPERPDNVIAIGSGEDHALTAMDMGATAKEAVKWAMKRDTGTGGRIRTFKVKT